MMQLTSISSRKRPLPNDEGKSGDLSTCSNKSMKRERTLSPSSAASSGPNISILRKNVPPTPPRSAREAATMALKLVIPQEQTSREQQKKLNRHRADAERWKPKLQRPYPSKTEIKLAYPLKLMRHYPATTTRVQREFVRPSIDRSPRVSRLLEQFPLIDTTQSVRTKPTECFPSSATPLDQAIPLSARVRELREVRQTHLELQRNIHITGTEYAQRLAWLSFSQTERDRVDRGREAMMQSGLLVDDLKREAVGQRNTLPEWKKFTTGRFAQERHAACWRTAA